MYTRALSLGLSIILNLIFLTLILTGFTFNLKQREMILISLEESPTDFPKAESGFLQREVKAKPEEGPFQRRESAGSEKDRRIAKEEQFLQERISNLKGRQQRTPSQEREDEANYIQHRLSAMRERGESVSKVSPSSATAGEGRETSGKEPVSEQRLSSEYLFLVRRKLQTHFEIPIYLKNRPNLSALVEIEVRDNGEIARINFIRASSDPTFNKAVESCLRAVSPLPVDRAVRLRIEFRSEGIGSIS